jgi:SAM-dependent methyltransferase
MSTELLKSDEKIYNINDAYENHYKKKNSDCHIYPVEWVVRTFLGSYPNLKMDQSRYQGSNILDLGFGDGRNFPLLHNLGFNIFGVEISENIIDIAKKKFAYLEKTLNLKLGRNSKTSFDENTFDYVLACHALYYVDPHETFTNNLEEMAKILKSKGILITSLPKPNGSILKNAKPLDNGHVEITNDPLGLRNGYVFRVFESKADIENTFSPYFDTFIIGSCDDDFFGIQQNVWTVICTRK